MAFLKSSKAEIWTTLNQAYLLKGLSITFCSCSLGKYFHCRVKENVQSEESSTSKTILDGSNSNNAVVICQEESSNVLSTGLQAETAAVANAQNDDMASQDVLPNTNHSMAQKDALLHSQDSVLLELDNSQCTNTTGAPKLMSAHIMKAIKDVPAPKLCSHTEWEETNIVSPVEELQKRLIKHASVISPEVVEDSGKIIVLHIEIKAKLLWVVKPPY